MVYVIIIYGARECDKLMRWRTIIRACIAQKKNKKNSTDAIMNSHENVFLALKNFG